MLGFDAIAENAIAESDEEEGDGIIALALKVVACGEFQPGATACGEFQPGVTESGER